jgi:hypothetical protein
MTNLPIFWWPEVLKHLQYDSPYVKGLPITVTVEELTPEGDIVKREMLSSYEDAYTAELNELYEVITNRKPIKTSAKDAINDLKIYDMMYKTWLKKEGKLECGSAGI